MIQNERAIYVDGDPSTRVINWSQEYDLLTQLLKGKNERFQHIVHEEVLGEKKQIKIYIKHIPGQVSLAIGIEPNERVVAFETDKESYEKLLQIAQNELATQTVDKRDLLFLAKYTRLPFSDSRVGVFFVGLFNETFEKGKFYAYDPWKPALEHIGWEK